MTRDINGMTVAQMASASSEIDGQDRGTFVRHFRGELLVTTLAAWRRHESLFVDLLDRMRDRRGPAEKASTEEHMWPIAFAALGDRVCDADDQIKRVWTSHNRNTIRPSDENLTFGTCRLKSAMACSIPLP